MYLQRPPDRAAVLASAAGLADEYSWPAYGARWEQLLQEARAKC
jgi:hypothetical protein